MDAGVETDSLAKRERAVFTVDCPFHLAEAIAARIAGFRG
jgi:hypothetical protein